MYYFSEYTQKTFDQILEYPLTIIEARAGCGKSTAVRGYFLKYPACGYRHLYYTCLNERPEVIWKGICREFADIDQQVSQCLSSMILPREENLDKIATQLRYLSCGEPTIFCIDNYQLFDVPCKDRIVEAFSIHNCSNLHIVMITQPYNLKENPYLAKYPFYYISAKNLYFTEDDIRKYFKLEGFILKQKELDTVWNVTEGYAAVIQLQLESWRHYGHFEIAAQISTLMERVVWRHLNHGEKECLLRLCTVESFSLRQGRQMIGNAMSGEAFRCFLEKIDFIKYDRGAQKYLFHHLLLTFVRSKFSDLPDRDRKRMWKQAAKAAESSGDSILAAGLYGKCDDFEGLVELEFNKDDRIELVRMEKGEIINQLIQPSKRNLLHRNPELALSLTLELYIQGKIPLHMQYLEEVKEILTELENYGEQRGAELMGEYCLMESFFAYNDVEKMCLCHRKAWSYMRRPTKLYSLNTAWTFGMPSVVSMFWREAGQLEQAFQEVKEGMPLYYKLSGGNGMGAHHAMEGEIALLRGRDEAAEQIYRKALCEAEKLEQDSICYCAYLGMARIAVLRGNIATYTHMQENIDDKPYFGKEASCIYTTDICKGYIAVLLERFQDVPEWLWNKDEVDRRSLMPARPFAHKLYGRLLLEQMKNRKISYEKFCEELYKLTEESRSLHMLLPEVYDKIYLVIGADMVGRQQDAVSLLRTALQMCRNDQVIVPFVENYGSIKNILEGLLLGGDMKRMKEAIMESGKKFLNGKKAILSAIHVTDKVLTAREREIAILLKSRFSVKEIAAKLCISPSTVSNTMQSIYGKLDIHSKRELYYREDI